MELALTDDELLLTIAEVAVAFALLLLASLAFALILFSFLPRIDSQ